jgi:guanine nucleotide-binding protein subunit alpha
MPALEISLSPMNDARRATILSHSELDEADVLPRDLADAIRGFWRGTSPFPAIFSMIVNRTHPM